VQPCAHARYSASSVDDLLSNAPGNRKENTKYTTASVPKSAMLMGWYSFHLPVVCAYAPQAVATAKLPQNTLAIKERAEAGIQREAAAKPPNPNTNPQAQRTESCATGVNPAGATRNALKRSGAKHMQLAKASAQSTCASTNASSAFDAS
jgi:hypothetical protein